MKYTGWIVLAALSLSASVSAEGPGDNGGSEGRYQMFNNPHANRMYILDTQTGRLFQLANYKDVGREVVEEIPYVYGSTRLCTPAEYERSPDKCFTRNYDYLKTLMDIKREQTGASASAPTESGKPEKK